MALPEVGTVWEQVRTFTQDDFDRFAALSGDDNPIHVDVEYSAATVWGRPVAHGMFLYSCLCGLLAGCLPGGIQERQDFKFPAPTYTGDEMTLRAEVTAVEGDAATLAVEVIDPRGVTTCIGETVVRLGMP